MIKITDRFGVRTVSFEDYKRFYADLVLPSHVKVEVVSMKTIAGMELGKILNQPKGLESLENGEVHLIKGDWTNLQCHLIQHQCHLFLYVRPQVKSDASYNLIPLDSDTSFEIALNTAEHMCRIFSKLMEIERSAGVDQVRRDLRGVLGL